MAENQGLCTFPGIEQVRAASVDYVHGIAPSTIRIELAPQRDFAGQGGDCTFTFNDQSYTFTDCKVDKNSFQRNSSGEIWSLSVFDRRWKWGWGRISGTYNVRGEDGKVKTSTDKSPRDLAKILLDEMDEEGYNVDDLPNDSRPYIEWEGRVPAEALEDLAELLGCRVVLQFTDKVKLCVVGEGEQLPEGGIVDNSLTIDPPEKPEKLGILCGRTRYQVDIPLEAVAEDQAGKVVPLNDVDWKPADGFANIDLPYFKQVTFSDNRYVERAKSQVFKWYRLSFPFKVPGYEENGGMVESIDQVVLLDEQNDFITEGQEKRQKPASVHGVFFTRKSGLTNCATDVKPPAATIEQQVQPNQSPEFKNVLKVGFSVDARKGLVKFSDFVYQNSEHNAGHPDPDKLTFGAAGLRLRTSIQIKDKGTLAPVRYEKTRDFGSSDTTTPTRFARHDEIVLRYTPTYGSSYSGDPEVADNKADVDTECGYYLDSLEKEYQVELPQTIRYAGLVTCDLDGAIAHISMQVGVDGGCTMAVSRNDEQVVHVVPYKERRDLMRQRELEAIATNNTPFHKREALRGFIPFTTPAFTVYP